jgi:protein disulfide-isomerase-like protein|eukprot:TRINITY_DN3011_c0_g2_i1.p1 TRINITY_DN3011_c0_g2~~TRINITY_DN3011_c0_g2_i1.p1  ORF type:complete len:239 (+),score=47.47 TRINITY_DN3011_c0_g2_i1:53-769(+)
MLQCLFLSSIIALLAALAHGEAVLVTEKTWTKEVTERVANGQFVFVKFFAPWCGHCKKMKPDWDKLGEKMNYKTNAHIVDVDCTVDDGKKLCTDHGASGYPTLKYFKKGGDPKGDSYDGGRTYNDFKKFATRNSKKPCDPASLENCGKKDKAYLEEIKDWDAAKLQEALDSFTEQLASKRKAKESEDALFEQQKDLAIATQKRADALKTEVGKLTDKTGYKIDILSAKLTPVPEKQEL